MKIQFYQKYFTFENYLQVVVLSIPPLLITGPFLPDLFLSLSALSFLVYLVFKRKINFLSHSIFYLFLIFFSIILLSSLLSDYKAKSLFTSLSYFRFGIFIFVIGFLINKKINFIENLRIILTLIFSVLFIDAIFQKLTGANIFGTIAPYGRITSLFGENVKLGGYIARITPLFIAVLVYLKSNRNLIFSVFFSSLLLTFISGERTSFFMTVFFFGGYLILSNITLKFKFFFLLAPLILIIIVFFDQEIKYRVLTSTYNQINILNKKPFFETLDNKDGTSVILHRDSTVLPRIYHMYFSTAVKIFKDNILFGSGPRTYAFKSKEEKYFTISSHEGWIKFVKKHNEETMTKIYENHKNQINKIVEFQMYKDLKNNINLINEKKYIDWLKSNGLSHINFNERIKDKEWLKGHGVLSEEYEGFTNISGVNSHPHHTYLQLLSETGLLGFSYILLLWLFCIFKLFLKLDIYYKCLLLGLIINLFPFMFSGNFFSGWLSILYFYPLGFLLKKVKS
jgi:O-antigen ligase